MNRLWLDFLFALRSLRHHPGFSIVAVLTVSLGIGTATAIFSVVDAVLLRPLPYPDSERLIRVWSAYRQSGVEFGDISNADLLDFGRLTRTLDGVAGFYPYDSTWLDDEGNAVKFLGAAVTHNFFDVLGVSSSVGRTFVPDDTELWRPGAPESLVLGHRAWQTLFGGRPDVVGRTVIREGLLHTVVGVAPPGFDYPEGAQGWISVAIIAEDRQTRVWKAVARVKSTSSLRGARVDLEAVAQRLEQDYPGTNNGMGVSVVPLRTSILGNLQGSLLILMGAAGVLLLISCVNVANLLLARGAARTREIALRAALGAGRVRIALQLLTESVVLALTAAVIGTAGAWLGVRWLGALGPSELTRYESLGFDVRVLLIALGASVVTGILFGFAPALRLATLDLRAALAEGGPASSRGKGFGRLRDFFVISELTLALVLVVGAGLLARSFIKLQNVDVGFRSENVLTFEVGLPVAQYDDFEVGDFYTDLLQRLDADPRVISAAAASTLPLGPQVDFLRPVVLDGRPTPLAGQEPQAYLRQVSSGFFAAMGIEMLEGREFDSNDLRDSPGVVIISEGFATRHYSGENPVGQRITGIPTAFGSLGRLFNTEPEIIGVAKDVRFGSVAEPSPLSIFMAAAQAPVRRMTVVLETTSDDPLSLIPVVRREVNDLDPGLVLGRVDSLERIVSASLASERFSMFLLGLFAAAALALASVGIYGVISYGVKERTFEIAVRRALGAEPSHILSLIFVQAGRLVGIAIPAGLFIAWASGRIVANQLYEVSARDPIVFGSVTGAIVAVAFLATAIPALRALGVKPSEVLRHD